MGKKYYDRFGYIYHRSYNSLWADNEQKEQAQKLNKITDIIELCIIRHRHPDWEPVPGHPITNHFSDTFIFGRRDIIHTLNHQHYHIDEANYHKRESEGFPK